MPFPSLKAVIGSVIEADPTRLTEASGLDQTDGWDSLRQMLVMSEVEKAFGIRFSFDQIENSTTIAEIRKNIRTLGVEAAD